MCIGLSISAISTFVFGNMILNVLYSLGIVGLLAFVGLELGVAFFFNFRLRQMSKTTAWICYVVYAFLTGISLSSLVMFYTPGSVLFAFISTAVLFGCMAIIGHTTNLDLTRFSSLMFAGLIGIIVTTLLNVFIFHSSTLDMMITFVSMLIFLGIIAYDMQMLRNYYSSSFSDAQMGEKMMIFGAFQLYLDFINLFMDILKYFGKRRDD